MLPFVYVGSTPHCVIIEKKNGRLWMEILNLGSHRIGVRFPEKGLRKDKNPAILLNDGELIEQLNLRTERAVLVGVYPNNRLSEYTPWPEPAIRPGTPDFGGQLGQYHRELNNEILPALIDEYALDTDKLAYGGYSLGGLAAVMSLWETEVFASVFSLCGSFWYPGVADFIEEHPLLNRSARVYLQNGTREGEGHNNRLSEAAAYAQRVHTVLRTVCGAKTVFDDNGHHDRQNERFCTVLRWVEQIL